MDKENVSEFTEVTSSLINEKYQEFKKAMLSEAYRPQVTKEDRELTINFFKFMDGLINIVVTTKDPRLVGFRTVVMQITTFFMSLNTDLLLLSDLLSSFQAEMIRREADNETDFPSEPQKPLSMDEPINGRVLELLKEFESEDFSKKTKH